MGLRCFETYSFSSFFDDVFELTLTFCVVSRTRFLATQSIADEEMHAEQSTVSGNDF